MLNTQNTPFLPLSLVRAHAEDMARAARQKAAQNVNLTPIGVSASRHNSGNSSRAQARKQAYAINALNQNAAVMRSTPEGGGFYHGRSNALYTLLCKTLNLAYTLPGTISETEVIDTLSRAAAAAGLPNNEVNSAVKSALGTPREILRSAARIDFDDNPDGPGPKGGLRQPLLNSSNPVKAELRYVPLDEYENRYEDSLTGGLLPNLAKEQDTQNLNDSADLSSNLKKSEDTASVHILQNATEIEYLAALPDSWLFAIEDVRGGLVAGLLNALYGLLNRGLIQPWADSETIFEALTNAGYVLDSNTFRKALSAAVKAQFIEAASSKFVFPKMQHYKIDIERESSLCCNSGKTKNARRFYHVLQFEALGRVIQARIFEALIDDFYPHTAEAFDEAVAERLTLDQMRAVLTTLKGRTLNSLSAASVWAAVPQTLKTVTASNDLEAKQENARRRTAFYAAIRAIPSLVTAKGLMAQDAGLDAQTAEMMASKMNQVSGEADTHGLIALKWAVMLRSYKQRMAALEALETTAFTETRLEAKAQMDALRRARLLPHDNQPMTGKAQAERLGVDNRASAVRASKRLGLRREERSERRLVPVKRLGDAPLPIEAVQSAIRAVVKKGEFATHVFSYDNLGKPLDNKPMTEIEDLCIGSTIEVQVQMPSILHVEAMPERAERVKADAAQENAEAESAVSATPDSAPRRVLRTSLYTEAWVLHNMIAPRIPQRGGLWIHPETGELFEDVRSVLYALVDLTPPISAQDTAEAVSA